VHTCTFNLPLKNSVLQIQFHVLLVVTDPVSRFAGCVALQIQLRVLPVVLLVSHFADFQVNFLFLKLSSPFRYLSTNPISYHHACQLECSFL